MIRHRLLIIEEETNILKQYRQHFSPDYEVIVAGDPYTGLRRGLEAEPDLIILSLASRTEETNLLIQFKSIQQLAQVPVFAIRTNPTLTEIDHMMKFNLDLVLLKPVTPQKLEEEMAPFLNMSPPRQKRLTPYEIQGFE